MYSIRVPRASKRGRWKSVLAVLLALGLSPEELDQCSLT